MVEIRLDISYAELHEIELEKSHDSDEVEFSIEGCITGMDGDKIEHSDRIGHHSHADALPLLKLRSVGNAAGESTAVSGAGHLSSAQTQVVGTGFGS